MGFSAWILVFKLEIEKFGETIVSLTRLHIPFGLFSQRNGCILLFDLAYSVYKSNEVFGLINKFEAIF